MDIPNKLPVTRFTRYYTDSGFAEYQALSESEKQELENDLKAYHQALADCAKAAHSYYIEKWSHRQLVYSATWK